MLALKEVYDKVHPNKDGYKGYLIALDPGETTGYAVFHNTSRVESGQLQTKDLDMGCNEITALFTQIKSKAVDTSDPIRIICEDYRVYSWKTEQHNWAGLHTPKLIGAIHYAAYMYKIPVEYEMAVEAKNFCTDEKLRSWGLYIPGERHARDAIRHACFYLLFKGKAG